MTDEITYTDPGAVPGKEPRCIACGGRAYLKAYLDYDPARGAFVAGYGTVEAYCASCGAQTEIEWRAPLDLEEVIPGVWSADVKVAMTAYIAAESAEEAAAVFHDTYGPGRGLELAESDDVSGKPYDLFEPGEHYLSPAISFHGAWEDKE